MCKECKTCMNKVHCIFWSTFAVSLACHEHYILNNYNFTSFTKRHVKPTDLAKDFMYVLVVVKVTSTLFVSLILCLFTVSHSAWIAFNWVKISKLEVAKDFFHFCMKYEKKNQCLHEFYQKECKLCSKIVLNCGLTAFALLFWIFIHYSEI